MNTDTVILAASTLIEQSQVCPPSKKVASRKHKQPLRIPIQFHKSASTPIAMSVSKQPQPKRNV